MTEDLKPLAHSQRYIDALGWAAELHRHQHRKGKPVPYISHLIGVSGLVWEDGGDEDLAIAALLHDAIEDAGISEVQIAHRFGERVARIVVDCTDTSGAVEPEGQKEPWLLRKTRYIEHLQSAHPDSLKVSAADKAHNARDMVLDARRDSGMWSKFNAGLDGSAWYLLRLHQTFSRRLEGSRSVALLGESVQEILHSEVYRACVPEGIAPAVWAAGYAKRQMEAKEREEAAAA
ncbi:MAG: HD domain-containing protein [Cyanobacteriota bacterium]|nr:HD domain-containing protein [Cyanobacteriota bacterium]